MPSKTQSTKPTPRLFEDQFNDLHSNCLEGTVEDIRNFFTNGNKVKHYDSGLTPLHVVVLSGRKDAAEVIDILIQHGVRIDDVTKAEEKTALHLVTEHGRYPQDFPIVVKLLEKKADTTMRDKNLRTAYDLALACDNIPLATTLDGTMDIDELQEFYFKKMAQIYGPYLIQAVLDSDEEGIDRNLQFHADPNLLNQHGAGAIHYSITHSTLPTIDLLNKLIQAGADVNLKDHENDTALNLAIKSDKLKKSGKMADVIRLLLKSGADQTIQDLDGNNAYDLANKRGYKDIMALLNKPQTKPIKEDSFIAQTPQPDTTPRREAVEHAPPKLANRAPSRSPTKSPTKSTKVEDPKPDDLDKLDTELEVVSNKSDELDDDLHEGAHQFMKKSVKLQRKSAMCTIL